MSTFSQFKIVSFLLLSFFGFEVSQAEQQISLISNESIQNLTDWKFQFLSNGGLCSYDVRNFSILVSQSRTGPNLEGVVVLVNPYDLFLNISELKERPGTYFYQNQIAANEILRNIRVQYPGFYQKEGFDKEVMPFVFRQRENNLEIFPLEVGLLRKSFEKIVLCRPMETISLGAGENIFFRALNEYYQKFSIFGLFKRKNTSSLLKFLEDSGV
jgi:hypothetical protein